MSRQLDMGNWNLKGGLNCNPHHIGDRSLQTRDRMGWLGLGPHLELTKK